MKKQKQILQDCEITKYYFANNNTITTCCKKFAGDLWICNIGWEFGKNLKKDWMQMQKEDIFMKKDTFNKIKLHEITELYKSLKKIKYKKPEVKLLIESLLIVNHDIKQEIFIQQKLF